MSNNFHDGIMTVDVVVSKMHPSPDWALLALPAVWMRLLMTSQLFLGLGFWCCYSFCSLLFA